MIKPNVSLKLQLKRHRRSLKSKNDKKKLRYKIDIKHLELIKYFGKTLDPYDVLHKFLPKNIKYILFESDFSDLSIYKLDPPKYFKDEEKLEIPINFSFEDGACKNTIEFLKKLLGLLVFQRARTVIVSYGKCKKISLEAQVFLDIILKDIITFFKRCNQYKKLKPRVKRIRGDDISNPDIKKLLYSVGSPAIHADYEIKFKDIIPYKLCIHNSLNTSKKNIAQKDVDTTTLADYVIDSLERMNISLSGTEIENLCNVIGEILINAEEHSSNNFRYSIGYFTEKRENGKHYGIFRLVIMNFGQTIYEKFKDPYCKNKSSVEKMRRLSDQYTRRGLFTPAEFEEETLWTLYSLQEGVTSTDPKVYKKRGNGSLRFIENFFKLRGKNFTDYESKMTIVSGKSRIIFDGKYDITPTVVDGETFQCVSFNESGNIMNKPDNKYVNFAPTYFPGTYISAEIYFSENI